MKKLILIIYHTGESKQDIRFIIRKILKIVGVKVVEVSETEYVENKE